MAESAEAEEGIGVRVLALCGKSLLIEGIKASLQDREGMKVVLLDASRPDVIQDLDKLNPESVVFELTPSQLSYIFPLLQKHTDVVCIGLDIAHDKALILSAEWRVLPTAADLMQGIEERIQQKKGGRL